MNRDVGFFRSVESMKGKTSISRKCIAALSSILVLAVIGFFSYQARNEIHYLCGNFKQGVTYASVIRQLDTTNLSSFTIEASESGKKIVHSSQLHFHLLRCQINFNQEEMVISASQDLLLMN